MILKSPRTREGILMTFSGGTVDVHCLFGAREEGCEAEFARPTGSFGGALAGLHR